MILSPLYHLSESYPQSVYVKNIFRTLATINGLQTTQGNRAKFRGFINAVYGELGILLLAYSGQRSYAQQWELRKKYLAGGPKAAAPGWSWHRYGRAIDTVPVNADGSLNWKTRDWAAIHKIAARYGLENGLTYADPGHILFRGDTTLSSERAINPGWEMYSISEDQSGSTLPKETENPRNFRAGRALLVVGLLTGAYFGGRYLYRRYAA